MHTLSHISIVWTDGFFVLQGEPGHLSILAAEPAEPRSVLDALSLCVAPTSISNRYSGFSDFNIMEIGLLLNFMQQITNYVS